MTGSWKNASGGLESSGFFCNQESVYTVWLDGQFIKVIVHLCLMHNARQAARRAGPSATTDIC